VQRWRIDLQRQITTNSSITLGYAGSYADRVNISRKLDTLPEQYWADGLKRNDAIAGNLNQNVTNPFRLANFASLQSSDPAQYQTLASRGFFTSSTIRKAQLLRAYPQMNGLTRNQTPAGEVKTHSFEAVFQKRFSHGFTLNVNYTALYQRDRDYYHNEFDALPSWRESNGGVPQRIAGTGIYELPFGPGRALARTGPLNVILGGWQVAATYEAQPGPLLDWGNLFYYGDTAQINSTNRTLDRWFNTDNFERLARNGPAAFHRRVFTTRVGGVRADGSNRWDANVQRDVRLHERMMLQFRVDALNLANRSQFAAPNRDPYSTDFGRVTSNTSSTMRYLMFQARVKF
jgi:hypothetical protein